MTAAFTALARGWRRRCPHCGQGPLFSGYDHLPSCSRCGLVYERNQGDTWAFTIIGDRIPVVVIIAVIYLGIGRSHTTLALVAFVIMAILLLLTARNRWGIGIALHYLSRLYWPDPSDPVPPFTS